MILAIGTICMRHHCIVDKYISIVEHCMTIYLWNMNGWARWTNHSHTSPTLWLGFWKQTKGTGFIRKSNKFLATAIGLPIKKALSYIYGVHIKPGKNIWDELSNEHSDRVGKNELSCRMNTPTGWEKLSWVVEWTIIQGGKNQLSCRMNTQTKINCSSQWFHMLIMVM